MYSPRLLVGLLALLFLSNTVNAQLTPVARDDEFTIHTSQNLNVLANDSPGSGIQPSIVTLPPANAGTLSGSANGWLFTITPAFTGTVTFTYVACNALCSQPATVTVHVVNTTPSAIWDLKIIRPEVPYSNWIDVGDNDFDLDGDQIVNFQIVTYPVNGTLEGTATAGRWVYHVNTPGFVGLDKFTYRAIDALGATETAEVTIFNAPVGYGDDDAGLFCPSVGQPVNVTNGNMWLSQTDFILPGAGENIQISRFYNSSRQSSGLFGFGWTTQYDESIDVINSFALRLTSPDGRASYFARRSGSDPFIAVSPGTYAKIEQNTSDGSYQLTYRDGRVRKFNQFGRLIWQQDRNGLKTTITSGTNSATGIPYVKVTDPFNRYLTLNLNPNGTVSSIEDVVSGIATYEYYSGTAVLKKVAYADGSEFNFEYDSTTAPGKTLLSIVKDALGYVVEAHSYDPQGRAFTSEKANGVERYDLNFSHWGESEPYTLVSTRKAAGGPVTTTKFFFDKTRGRNTVVKTEGLCGCGGGGSELTQYFYDESTNLVKTIDALGRQTVYRYDGDETRFERRGDLLAVEYSIGTTSLGREEFKYNSFGQIEWYRDKIDSVSGRNTVAFDHDPKGNLTAITNELGTTTISYPDDNPPGSPGSVNIGLPDSIKDARQNVTTFKWRDAAPGSAYPTTDRLEKVTDPFGKVTALLFDDRGRLKQITNPLGEETKIDNFDDTTRKTVLTYPNGDVVTTRYDVRRLLESVENELGQTTFYEYDAARRLKKITDPKGNVRQIGYDLMSNVESTKDGFNVETNYVYDDFNRLSLIRYPPAHSSSNTRMTESFIYDKSGRIKTYTDTAGRLTQYAFDDANRTASVTDAEGKTTMFGYNARNQMVNLVDAVGQNYVFAYDSLGNRLAEKRMRGSVVDRQRTFGYDPAGNVIRRVDFAGQVTRYEYDQLNRMKHVFYGDDSTEPVPTIPAATYGYDFVSRLKTATNDAGTVSFLYDGRGRVKSTTDVFGNVLGYEYLKVDAPPPAPSTRKVAQRRLKFNGSLYATYNYDPADLLDNVVAAADGKSVAFTYDANNRLTGKYFKNGTTTEFASTYGYDDLNRIETIQNGASSLSYTYNNASQIGSITSSLNGSVTYGYDNVDRLVSQTDFTPPDGDRAFEYDAVGNRLKSPLSRSHEYSSTGPFNQIKSMANAAGQATAFEHDANGNLTQKYEGTHLWRYTWDPDNRLVSVSDHRKTMVRYRYDALGRRIQRSQTGSAGKTTKFIYDGDDVLVDDNGDGNLTRYVNADGIDNKLRVQENGNAAKYFVTDHLGSTIGLADSTGSVSNQTTYDSFGNSSSTLPTRYRYTGREYDEYSGLYQYRARSYDPKTGRFISEDPIGLSGGVNQFVYVGNNPLAMIDPRGLQGGPVNYLRNPFSSDHWILNGTSNTVSDLLFLDHVAAWSWTIGDHRCSDSDRIWASAKLGGWIAFQVVGGWAVSKIIGFAGRVGGPVVTRLLGGFGDDIIELGISRFTKVTKFGPLDEVLANGSMVEGRFESTLSDGSKVIIRKDFGPNAHPIGSKYPTAVDHYNIEIHRPGRTPGRFSLENDFHLVVDSNGNVVNVFH